MLPLFYRVIKKPVPVRCLVRPVYSNFVRSSSGGSSILKPWAVPHGELQLLAGLVGQRQDVGGATGLCHDILDIALSETVNVRARRSCGKVIVPWLRLPGRGSPNSASDKVFAQDTGRLFRVFAENTDRRQPQLSRVFCLLRYTAGDLRGLVRQQSSDGPRPASRPAGDGAMPPPLA